MLFWHTATINFQSQQLSVTNSGKFQGLICETRPTYIREAVSDTKVRSMAMYTSESFWIIPYYTYTSVIFIMEIQTTPTGIHADAFQQKYFL